MQRIACGVPVSAAALAAAVLAGCGSSPATWAQLRRRASFDLDCPVQQLAITEIDRRTAGVDGCGQRATYVEMCESKGYSGYMSPGGAMYGSTSRGNCTWMLNGGAKGAKQGDDDSK